MFSFSDSTTTGAPYDLTFCSTPAHQKLVCRGPRFGQIVWDSNDPKSSAASSRSGNPHDSHKARIEWGTRIRGVPEIICFLLGHDFSRAGTRSGQRFGFS